jgi:hypothetical protein
VGGISGGDPKALAAAVRGYSETTKDERVLFFSIEHSDLLAVLESQKDRYDRSY